MIALTDFNKGSPLRNKIGWALLGSVMLTVGVNMIKALVGDSKRAGRYMKSKYRKW
jgi:hypothetical protein